MRPFLAEIAELSALLAFIVAAGLWLAHAGDLVIASRF